MLLSKPNTGHVPDPVQILKLGKNFERTVPLFNPLKYSGKYMYRPPSFI
jgi:hypothetical protein